MARGAKKNKTELSLEEKLAHALVPEEEQPYKVPENWCWTRIDYINRYDSCSVDPARQPENMFELYSVPSSAEDYPEIILGEEIGSTKQKVDTGDVLLCKINPRINRVWKVSKYSDNELLASSEWIVVRNNHIDSNYLMHCFRAPFFRDLMLSNVSGVGGSLMRAQPKYVKEYPVPIPPLPEQQRIVDRIESLFARLDEAKEKVEAVVDGYENRKAAILHKAFTGELTEKWRRHHGYSSDNWETVTFEDVAEVKSNLVDPCDYQDFPHIAPDNIEKKNGRLLEYNTIAEDKVKSGKHRFYSGQILYSKIRPYLSKVVIVDFDGLCSADMYPIEAKECMVTKYLLYYMLSDDFLLQASSAGSRSVLPKINQKELSRIKVRRTIKEEQIEVVRIVDTLLENEQTAKEAALTAIEQIDSMKKSILAKAFRGELGINDPSDESAIELLKQILEDK